MKKEASLEKILLRYSGAAAAVLSANALKAQPDTVLTVVDTLLDENGEYYNIDMDTNGVVDFRITQVIDSTTNDITGVIIEGRGAAANQVLGLDYGNYNYPFRLNVGDTIGSGRTFKGIGANDRVGYLGLMVGSTTYPNSQFLGGVTDGFLGVRFEGQQDSVAENFYGWIRVDVAADLRSMTIRDYAYVTVPDSMIRAGFGSPIDVEEVEYAKPEIAQRGQYLDISLPESFNSGAELKFYDLSGQLIESHKMAGRKETISLEGLPKGVVIARVESNGTEASRKLVVY